MFNTGLRIRNLRNLNKMSLKVLATKVNLTQPQLSRIENNINSTQLKTIFKLCEVFDISLSEFFLSDELNNSIPSYFKKFFNNHKDLTPDQLITLSTFIKNFISPTR